jgi:segregation and condensation protein A
MKSIEDHIFALDNFEGPLDFLLHLIQKSEIDIYEVPLHKITEQYLAKLQELISPAVDGGAEFIGTTASLLLLKSKMLLPKHEQPGLVEEEEIDPRFEIIHQLIEYCRFKDAAKELSELEQKQSAFFSRGIENSESKKPLGIEHLSMQDLATMFQHVLAKAASHRGIIQEEVWKVSDKISFIQRLLKDLNKIRFDVLFSPVQSRDELIVTFLAVLELMKMGELKVVKETLENVILLIKG